MRKRKRTFESWLGEYTSLLSAIINCDTFVKCNYTALYSFTLYKVEVLSGRVGGGCLVRDGCMVGDGERV